MLRRLLVIAGYMGLAALVALGTVLLVAYGQEYSFDFKQWKFVRTGLVVLQSAPSGVPVTVDGKLLKKKTSYRNAFEAGSYTFELIKDGYHPWRKRLDVVVAEVTLVQYALLVPKDPEVKPLDSRPEVVTQTMSRDHRHVAYVVGGANSDTGVHTLDIGGQPRKIYTPAPATTTTPAEVVTEITYSDDASHLLVVSKLGDAVTHRLMTAAGQDVVNLTEKYRTNLAGLRFSASDWRQLYWLSPEGLRRLNVNDAAVGPVLAERVRQFEVVKGRVLYVQATDLGQSLWSLDNGDRKQELVAALPDSESYAIAYTEYKDDEQLAVVPSRTRVGTLYSDVLGQTPVAKTVARDVTNAQFSPDGHLLAFYSDKTVVTYDLERSALRNKLVSYQLGNISGLSSLSWFDNFHLLLNMNGRLWWTEFDGANRLNLGPLHGAFPAYGVATGFGSSDPRSIVAFQPQGPGRAQLNQIIVKR